MGQIMELARSLGGGKSGGGSPPPPPSDQPEPPPAEGLSSLLSGGVDPRLLEVAGRFLSGYQEKDDERAALLEALRPFVRQERYARLDQAIRLSKMTRAVRIALTAFQSGRDSHV